MLPEGRLPARQRAPATTPRSFAYRNADMLGGQEPLHPSVLRAVSKQAAMDELKRKLDQARADLNDIAADFDALAQAHDVDMLAGELAELQAEVDSLPAAIMLDTIALSVAVATPVAVALPRPITVARPVISHFTAPVPESRAPAPSGMPPISVRIVGVGGSGGNTINRLAPHVAPYGAEHMRTIAINTDAQVLSSSAANDALLISSPTDPTVKRSRVGQGAGGNPSVGALAASSHADEIGAALTGADMVFVTGGMGGGTGSGAAPEVARLARQAGALTVGVVTRPFGFEGTRRAENANGAIAALAAHTDALVVISNDRLLSQLPDGTSIEAAFAAADDVLRQAICAVAEIVLDTGLVNVDFNDLRAVMKGSGPSLVGIGHAEGSAAEAARRAIECPLLETAAMEAKGIVFNVCGGRALSLREVHSAADAISEIVHPDANIIFGARRAGQPTARPPAYRARAA
jgi:cell division protein FtsZ